MFTLQENMYNFILFYEDSGGGTYLVPLAMFGSLCDYNCELTSLSALALKQDTEVKWVTFK